MKKRIVIKNVPSKLPILSTIQYSFLLWFFKVDSLWWGVFITLFAILWIVSIVAVCTEQRIDITEALKTKPNPFKVFADRLKEIAERRKAS